MTRTLSHAELEQLLPAAALEILEGPELLEVTAHVRECPQCTGQLQSYREVVAGLAHGLPERALNPARSAGLRARVLDRAAARTPVQKKSGEAGGSARSVWWSSWAIAAGLAGLLLIHHSVHRPVAYGWLAAGILTLVLAALLFQLKRQRARLSALERQLAGLDRSPQ